MAKRNIFSALNHPENHVSRNGFDLSHRKVFSAKAGQLLPILCEDVVPGDYFEIDTASLIRTMPLNTAAFLRARACFDFFFVPKTKLWSNYNAFISQRNVIESSALHEAAYEPNVTLTTLNILVNDGNADSTSVRDTVSDRAKVLQLLGYGDGMKTLPSGLDGSKSLTALPIAGYNAIFNWYYRNAWRDEPTSAMIARSNLDNYSCDTYQGSLIDAGTTDFVHLYPHSWYKDLFMGSLPNQQFGVVSSVDVSGGSVRLSAGNNVSVAGSSNPPTGIDPGSIYYGSGQYPQYSSSLSTNGATFDVLALRKALALQKWKEYNMRAGWKAKYQQRAMFGVDAPHDAQHEIDFIDSYEQIIQISEVISTANTSSPTDGNGNLAEIAGKGISAGGSHKIKYSVNQPGYIYCIFYIIPEAEYDQEMIDRQLVRSEPFDHYTPAFENLGMQAIHKSELSYKGNASVFDNVIGYAPNYYEYKTRVDKVYGPFTTNGSLSPWVSVRRDIQNMINTGTLSKNNFYIDPRVLDPLFAVACDGTQDTDQFIINCNFDIKAVRPMSVLGLPTL